MMVGKKDYCIAHSRIIFIHCVFYGLWALDLPTYRKETREGVPVKGMRVKKGVTSGMHGQPPPRSGTPNISEFPY